MSVGIKEKHQKNNKGFHNNTSHSCSQGSDAYSVFESKSGVVVELCKDHF